LIQVLILEKKHEPFNRTQSLTGRCPGFVRGIGLFVFFLGLFVICFWFTGIHLKILRFCVCVCVCVCVRACVCSLSLGPRQAAMADRMVGVIHRAVLGFAAE
jgi:hypothetical protein